MGLCNAKCTSMDRLDGKTALVTGANTGIGKCTVQDFYRRGANVIMACRNVEKAEEAAADIKKNCEGEENLGTIAIIKLDLASLNSVRHCAKTLLENEQQINLLINNAGVMFCAKSRTEDGFETQFGTNHLGPFLFTLLLLPKIIKSAPARIVNVSSIAHTLHRGPIAFDDLNWKTRSYSSTQAYYQSKLAIVLFTRELARRLQVHRGPIAFDDLNWKTRSYSSTQAYYQSKLAIVLFTRELARRLQEAGIEGVTTYSLHPGVISTELGRHLNDSFVPGSRWFFNNVLSLFIKTPQQGAETTIYCSVDEKAGSETGLYYAECKVKNSSAKSRNAENAKKLWDISLEMVGLNKDYNPFAVQSQTI